MLSIALDTAGPNTVAQGIDSGVGRRSLSTCSTNEEPRASSFTRRPRHWTITNMTSRSVLLNQPPVAGPSRALNPRRGVAANNSMVAVGQEGPPLYWADLLGPLVHKIAKLLGNEVDVASMRATTRYFQYLSTVQMVSAMER